MPLPFGIIPPVATPMQATEDLDLPRLVWFIDHLCATGIHAAFVLGTNSECYALSENEKQAVIATAVQHLGGRLPVYAGTGAETTREALRLTKLAEKERVDAVTIITPYFIQPNQNELFDYYRRLSEATPLPIVLYSNPAHTSVKIMPETVARLAELKNIVGIKDSSGDLQLTLDYVRLCPPGFAVLQGRDTLIYPSLEFGCVGAVPASGNIAPKLCVEIYEAWKRGDNEAAKAAQLKLNPARLSLGLATPPAGVKAALRLLGVDLGPCRGPIGDPPAVVLEKMKGMLREAGLL